MKGRDNRMILVSYDVIHSVTVHDVHVVFQVDARYGGDVG